MKITKFEDIEAWKKARELTKIIYKMAGQDLFAKDWGLRDQIQRASVSVMSNIAEGFDAGSKPEFCRFLKFANRSCSEIQNQLYIALDQNYINRTTFNNTYDLISDIKKMINGFIRYLLGSSNNNSTMVR